jgi:hypothetical protein
VHAAQSSIYCHLTVLALKSWQLTGFARRTAVGAVPHRGRGWGGATRGRAAQRGGGRGPRRRAP